MTVPNRIAGTDLFQRALAEAERNAADPSGRAIPTALRAPLPLGAVENAGLGGRPLWDEGEEAGEGVPHPAHPVPSGLHPSDEIARAAGLPLAETSEELRAARRRFLWENHPDRKAPEERVDATERVQIANMLFDRAEAQLSKARPRRG